MVSNGKRRVALLGKIDLLRLYSASEGLDLIKETASAKFDESVDVVYKLGLDPKQNENRIRGTVILPQGRGKTECILVFAKGEKVKEAEEAGADFVGAEELVEKVAGGWLEFDRVIATPDIMSVVSKLGRILGPRGMMPSPKSGTVTPDVGMAVQEFKSGKIEFRLDEYGNVHAPFGLASFSSAALQENLVALSEAILSEKPEGAKGKYIKGIAISTTMGPGIKLDPDALLNMAKQQQPD